MIEEKKVSEFTEVGMTLKNTSKTELMKCFEAEFSGFETTQMFETVRIFCHVSVACKKEKVVKTLAKGNSPIQ